MKQNDNAVIINPEKLSAESKLFKFAQNIGTLVISNPSFLARTLLAPDYNVNLSLLLSVLFFHPILASHPFHVCPDARSKATSLSPVRSSSARTLRQALPASLAPPFAQGATGGSSSYHSAFCRFPKLGFQRRQMIRLG